MRLVGDPTYIDPGLALRADEQVNVRGVQGDPGRTPPNAVAASADTLGEVHAARGEREEALTTYRRALEVYERIGYRARIEQVRASIRSLAG